MTTLNTAELKEQLLAQRRSLLDQRNQLRGGNVSRAEASAAHFAHTEDSPAQVNTERDLELALDEHETAELAAVQAALQRLEDGSYGDCVDCGTHIAPARLQAAPEAARCIHCQEKAEKAGHA